MYIETAIKTDPNNWEPYYYASMTLCRKGDYLNALTFVDKSIELNPNNTKLLSNRATILGGLGKYYEAIDQYREVLKINENSANESFYLGTALITIGEYEEGWKRCSMRFNIPKVQQFCQILPKIDMWNGEPLEDKSILLFCEQGCGDMIHFVRYAKDFKKAGARVTILTPKPLSKLIRNCEGVDEVMVFDPTDPTFIDHNFDYTFSVWSSPLFFGVRKEDKYIYVDKSPIKLKSKFVNVGICWAGSELHENDCVRSCRLKEFKALKGIPDVKFYSLQKPFESNNLLKNAVKMSMTRKWRTEGYVDLMESCDDFNMEDYTSIIEDFNDTAEFISQLDLVITVDTAVAHIAAALGKPTWILLGFYPDYRWLTARSDSVWYSSVKLFRQPTYTSLNWPAVFDNVRKELENFVLDFRK